MTSGDGKAYDLDAAGVGIRFVLEALARRSGANIVVSPDVTGEVTAHLKQQPLDAILEQLAAVGGFAWRKDGATYLVANKDKLTPLAGAGPKVAAQRVAAIEVWECRYIKPSDAASLIEKLLPEVKTAEGPASYTPTLDSNSPGLGGASGSYGAAPAAGGASAPTSTRYTSNRLVLMGEPTELERARELLRRLDVRRPQVNIDVAITEINSSAKKELGITWSWSDLILTESSSGSGIHFGNLNKEDMTFTATISALTANGVGDLLAQPNLSVVDGESASILIGDRLLYPKLVGYSSFGTPIYDKEEEEVGISLQIAPKVTGDGEIIMSLYPQVSLVTGYLKTQAGEYPQISTREARTTVSVKNGATVAIGGLLQSDEIKQKQKVPILGDLPIIGAFFRHSSTTRERTEIVIFLSPKIVEEK